VTATARRPWLSSCHFKYRRKGSTGCLHTGNRVDEPIGSQPYTHWLGRTRVFPTSRAGPNFYDESFHITQIACIYLDTAVISVKDVRLYIIPVVQPQEIAPAAGGESHCSVTMPVAQPLSLVSSQKSTTKTLWSGRRQKLRGPCESSLAVRITRNKQRVEKTQRF